MVGPNFRVGKKIGCGNFGELRLGEKGGLCPHCTHSCWHCPGILLLQQEELAHAVAMGTRPHRVEALSLAGNPCSVTEVPVP